MSLGFDQTCAMVIALRLVQASMTFLSISLFIVACSSSTPSAQEVPQVEPEEQSQAEVPAASAPEPAPAGPAAVPSTCEEQDGECLPPAAWVRKLCADVYPAVALYLFQKEMPFTHGYLSRRTQAVNASGGATSGSEWLAFDEEVILLSHRRQAKGGFQVGDSDGNYDALRWDGSCVSLDSSEVRLQKPPAAKATEIPWRSLGKDIQSALKKNAELKSLYKKRKNECKGAFSGEVSRKCIRLTKGLNQKIVQVVKDGSVTLPEPQRRP